MKKTILMIGTVVGLAGSAGAGYFAMQSGPGGDDGADGHGSHAETTDPEARHVDIEPLVVPLVKNDRILHHVYLSVSLEVAGKSDVPPVLAKKFRLHHAFLMALYDREIQTPDDPKNLDRDKIKSILKREANRLLAENLVRAIHIREAVHGKG